MSPKIVFSRLVAILAGVGPAFSLLSARADGSSIIITNLPAYGSAGNLSGLVSNADVAANCVVVCLYEDGGWYSKPSCASPLTLIHPDGSWSADITTSGSDTNASEIAAFLASTNYNPPCLDGAAGLLIPPEAEAAVYADRVNPSARQFNFSDYGWWVKNSAGSLAGPGPNYFSDSTNNVWVDAEEELHLKISYTNSTWQCAEIISDRNFGYGQYRFTVNTPINSLDPNVVLGMFTYSYDIAYNNREIDLELSRWNDAFGTNNVEDYAVAPYGTGQVLRFGLPAGTTNSTHSFIWQSNGIAFQTLNGDFDASPPAADVLESWNSSIGTPPAGGEQVHINLWLDNGNPPADGEPVEVIISKFEFVPLGPPPSAQLSQLTGLRDGPIQLSVNGQADWHYQILSSPDLVDWTPIGTVLATNSWISSSSRPASFRFADTNPISLDARFYRILTEP